jgi:hypothetical protein
MILFIDSMRSIYQVQRSFYMFSQRLCAASYAMHGAQEAAFRESSSSGPSLPSIEDCRLSNAVLFLKTRSTPAHQPLIIDQPFTADQY